MDIRRTGIHLLKIPESTSVKIQIFKVFGYMYFKKKSMTLIIRMSSLLRRYDFD